MCSGGSPRIERLQSWSLSFFFFCFLGLHLQHMEVPRLGVELGLQPPAYTTATATQDLSRVCDLQHSSRQCWILKPLSTTRDRTCILMDTSQICFHCTTMRTPKSDVIMFCHFGVSLSRCNLCAHKVHVSSLKVSGSSQFTLLWLRPPCSLSRCGILWFGWTEGAPLFVLSVGSLFKSDYGQVTFQSLYPCTKKDCVHSAEEHLPPVKRAAVRNPSSNPALRMRLFL